VATAAPQIQTQPANITANIGDSPTFSVTANGTAPFTYQWQRMPALASAWSNLTDDGTYAGSSAANLTVTNATAIMNGDRFQCLVTNALGNATSAASTLTVQSPPTFITEPISTSVSVGDLAQFNVAAIGVPTPTYQWQVLPAGASSWVGLTDNTTIAGSATSALSVKAAAALNGAQFSCVATNGISPNATSTAALLTVYPAGYTEWAAGLDLAGNGLLPAAAPFGDTLPNLARFAMNIGAVPAAGQLPALSVQVVNGVAYLRLDYNVSKNLNGLQVFVQSSSDLQVWQKLSNTAIAQLADPNAQTSHYQASIAIPANGLVFLRLAIQAQ